MKQLLNKGILREFMRILQDRNLYIILLLTPIFYIFFYGSIYYQNLPYKVEIGWIDQDHSYSSQHYRMLFESNSSLNLHRYTDLNKAEYDIQKQKIGAYLIVPRHFEKDLKKGKKTVIGVYISAVNFLVTNEITKYIQTPSLTFSSAINMKFWKTRGLNTQQALAIVQPVKIDIHGIGNPGYGYGSFFLVGLFMLILQQLFLIGISESTAKEMEQNTLSDWSMTAHHRIHTMFVHKATPYILLFIIYFFFMLAFPFSIFYLNQKASLFSLFLLVLPFFITLGEVGIFLGSFFSKQLQAIQFVAMTSIPLLFMSGFSWLYIYMPIPIQVLNCFLPSHFLLTTYQTMTQTNASLGDMWVPWMILWLQMIAWYCILYARLSYLQGKSSRSLSTD